MRIAKHASGMINFHATYGFPAIPAIITHRVASLANMHDILMLQRLSDIARMLRTAGRAGGGDGDERRSM